MPLNTVNFEGRAHREQLKGMLEQVGLRKMTDQLTRWPRVGQLIRNVSQGTV